jgi:hypothetical protein
MSSADAVATGVGQLELDEALSVAGEKELLPEAVRNADLLVSQGLPGG